MQHGSCWLISIDDTSILILLNYLTFVVTTTL